jgi:glyoxylase-like metal-dependent hydrolase (beta-lactamase superfamily II)
MTCCGFHILQAGLCYHPAGMARQGAGLCPTEFPALAGLILHPSEGAILFDTGYDPAFFTATQEMPERLYRWATPVQLKDGHAVSDQLQRFGLSPDDVRCIVISHFHGDHIAGLHAFPKARLFCSRHGADQLTQSSRFGRVRRGLLSGLTPPAWRDRARFFEDMPRIALNADLKPFDIGVDVLGDGSLIAVPLPGHCIGHWGLLLKNSEGRDTFLVGDAAWSLHAIRDNIPPPGLTTSLLGDTKTYRGTLTDLHALSARNRDILIAPSHCPEIAAMAVLPP